MTFYLYLSGEEAPVCIYYPAFKLWRTCSQPNELHYIR